jgi:hypothetical protein
MRTARESPVFAQYTCKEERERERKRERESERERGEGTEAEGEAKPINEGRERSCSTDTYKYFNTNISSLQVRETRNDSSVQ